MTYAGTITSEFILRRLLFWKYCNKLYLNRFSLIFYHTKCTCMQCTITDLRCHQDLQRHDSMYYRTIASHLYAHCGLNWERIEIDNPSRRMISSSCSWLCGTVFLKVLLWCLEAETIWTQFSPRHFEIHLLEWKCVRFDQNLSEFVCRGPINNITLSGRMMALFTGAYMRHWVSMSRIESQRFGNNVIKPERFVSLVSSGGIGVYICHSLFIVHGTNLRCCLAVTYMNNV